MNVATDTDIKIPVASLYPDRYGIGKTKLYERLKNLRLEPFSNGRQSFITVEQLELLDGYCKACEAGKEAAAAYLAAHVQPVHERVHTGTIVPNLPPAWLALLEALASRLLLPPPPDPLLPQRQLQEIAEQHWEVSKSQLAKILGTRHFRDGDRRYGFQLLKHGKVGRQSAWKVLKQD